MGFKNTMLAKNRQLDCMGNIVFYPKYVNEWTQHTKSVTHGRLRFVLNARNAWIIYVFRHSEGDPEEPFELVENTIQTLPRRFESDGENGYIHFAVMAKSLKTITLDAAMEPKVEREKVKLMCEIVQCVSRRKTVSVSPEKWNHYTTEYKPNENRFALELDLDDSYHVSLNRGTSRVNMSLSPVTPDFENDVLSPEKRRRTVDSYRSYSKETVCPPSHQKRVRSKIISGKENDLCLSKLVEPTNFHDVDWNIVDTSRGKESYIAECVSSLSSHPPRYQSTPYNALSLSPGRYGFTNLGNTCYMNALLQSLRRITAFTDLLKSVEGPLDSRSLSKLLKALMEHNDLHLSPTSVLRNLNMYFSRREIRYKLDTQNDVHEFALFLLNCLIAELGETRSNSPEEDRNDAIEHPFLWRSIEKCVCQNPDCNSVSRVKADNTEVKLPLRPMTLQDMIHNYGKMEMFEKQCQKCSNGEAIRSIKVTSTPRALMLVLMRYEHKLQRTKKNSEDVYIEEKIEFNHDEYDLSSVIVHRGPSIDHGHYICYVRDDTGSAGGYSKFNDDYVTSLDKDTFRKETKSDGYLCFYTRP